MQLLDRPVSSCMLDSCFVVLMLHLLSLHIGNLLGPRDLCGRSGAGRSSARTTCHGGYIVVLGVRGTLGSNFGILFEINALSLGSDFN